MEPLNQAVSVSRFFAELRRAEQGLLMLDYDGTLAPFRPERDQAFPYPGIEERLQRLDAAERNRTVIVSGRSISDLLPLLDLESPPEIWGCHGAERLTANHDYRLLELPMKARQGLDEVDRWAAASGLTRHLETKPASRAFHWRGLEAEESKRIAAAVKTSWASRGSRFPLELHAFDGGLEIRATGISKADAVRTAIAESEAAVRAYLGDDLTDEDAFTALQGHGLRVLVRRERRPTEADLWLRPPDQLLEFLDLWLQNIA